jgi:ribulose-5-phosphate 4-epimerase/fuculose-1-phosphate aldolase
LIRTPRLGEHLAACFAEKRDEGYNPVVLMRGHGFTVAGASIEESVFRAIYTAENARVQSASLSLQLAAGTTPLKPDESLYYLEDAELDAATEMGQWSVMRPWTLWVKEVEAGRLYINSVE